MCGGSWKAHCQVCFPPHAFIQTFTVPHLLMCDCAYFTYSVCSINTASAHSLILQLCLIHMLWHEFWYCEYENFWGGQLWFSSCTKYLSTWTMTKYLICNHVSESRATTSVRFSSIKISLNNCCWWFSSLINRFSVMTVCSHDLHRWEQWVSQWRDSVAHVLPSPLSQGLMCKMLNYQFPFKNQWKN